VADRDVPRKQGGGLAGPIQVPYAKKWQKETDKLRNIALDCFLTEEVKWSKPCFTFQKKNVAIVIPLRDACALAFFKGALTERSEGNSRTGWRTHAGRSLDQVHLGQRDHRPPVDPARLPL
jgi:uncharacterized protein YdeI (YjbR/CyaY-like superfamily)